MNKMQDIYSDLKSISLELTTRLICYIKRKPYRAKRSPRWQQLELPLSHTARGAQFTRSHLTNIKKRRRNSVV